MSEKSSRPVLVTGATGYVAGRLIPLLLSSGYRVRAMGRSIDKMKDRPWGNHQNIELVKGDIMDVRSLETAVDGCATIYYLVHSMISKKGAYRDADRKGAANMALAAENKNAEQIIYLGGLGEIHHKNISKHLLSRNEVGKILARGPVPVTTLRAAMILGSGSASFEILRYLTERLPVMITPKWVRMLTQPIAISNVLEYLKGCLENPEMKGRTYDIGGPDIVAYRDLFCIFAEEAGLFVPKMIPVPVLTPKLSSLWIHLVTPVPAEIARPLTEGLSLPTLCTENEIHKMIPQKLLSCREAIRLALERIEQEKVASSWSDAGYSVQPEWAYYGDSDYSGGTLLKCTYRAEIKGEPGDLWPAIESLGGETGYYAADILWRIRGGIDMLLGGVGLKRGRRSKKSLQVGDALDFWRVLSVEKENRLLLIAEMKLPGEALLELSLNKIRNERCELVLSARFMPKGLFGILYWYSVYPFHLYIFSNMLRGIVDKSGLKLLGSPRPVR